MERSNKLQELTAFLKFLIESTNIYKVNKDNTIIYKDNNEPVIIDKNNELPIKLFTIPLPTECIVLNPINELLTESKDTKWFYLSLAMSVSMKIKGIIKYLIDLIPIQDKLEIEVIKELSKYLELLDKKSYKEIDTITTDYIEFCNIYYNKRLRKAYFRTGIFEESFRGKFKNIRKKTWKFLDLLFCNMFDITYEMELEEKRLQLIEKYHHHTNKINCPKFISFVNVYNMVLDRINIISDTLDIEEYILDLSQLSYYISNIDEYYKLSKWAHTSSGNTTSSESNESKSTHIDDDSPSLFSSLNTNQSIINTQPQSQLTLPGMVPTTTPSIINTQQQPQLILPGVIPTMNNQVVNNTGIISTNNTGFLTNQPTLGNTGLKLPGMI